MTAAELASFRALLQAQAAAQPGPERGLFARMRARLTVVEGGRGVSTPSPHGASTQVVAAAAEPGEELAVDGRLADPPPSQPPAFGRREFGAPPTPSLLPAGDAVRAAPAPDDQLERMQAVRLARRSIQPTGPSTPDDLDDLRPAEPPTRPDAPAPGVIAGWSRARPPSAQRRLLGRLEAVLIAEREGLEARRAADAPAG